MIMGERAKTTTQLDSRVIILRLPFSRFVFLRLWPAIATVKVVSSPSVVLFKENQGGDQVPMSYEEFKMINKNHGVFSLSMQL